MNIVSPILGAITAINLYRVFAAAGNKASAYAIRKRPANSFGTRQIGWRWTLISFLESRYH